MQDFISLLERVPFAAAALRFDSSAEQFLYGYANERYRRTMHGGVLGKPFLEGRAGLPSEADLRGVYDSGEMWWHWFEPSEERAAADAPWAPFIRVLARVWIQGQPVVLDIGFHFEEAPHFEVGGDTHTAAEREELLRRVEQELANTSLLATIATLASSSLTLQKICQRTLAGMREQVADLVSGAIYVLEHDDASLRTLTLFAGDGEVASPETVSAVSASTDAGALVMHGHHQLTHENGGAAAGTAPTDAGVRTSRWIDLAIERRGTLLGVLELGFEGDGAFEPDELRLYQGIAAVLGNAIGNARSYEAESRNARIAEGIGRILGAALNAPDEESLGRECLTVVEEITDSAFGFFATRSGDGFMENVAISDRGMAVCRIAQEAGAHGRQRWPLKGLYSVPFNTRETLITSDPANHPASSGLPEGHEPLDALMVTPLMGKDGSVFGVMALGNRPGGYSATERSAVESLSPAIVEAVERFRAERQLADNARFADELNHIESIIHASLDFDTIAEEALRTGREALGADSASLALYESPNFRVTHAIGFPSDIAGLLIPEDRERHSLIAIRTKGPVLIEDAATDDRADDMHLRSLGIVAVMAVPLIVGGRVFGTAYYNYAQPHLFSDAEVRFALRLSLSLSLAMENARLYETERTIANRLQKALLALPDHVTAVEFAHAYYPATEAAKVGGDFYDIFELSYGHVGITVGDVAGKGIDAAALTSLVKNTIRAHASERGKMPSQILSLTNEVLYKTTPVESFVTVFFAMLDTRDGRLVYANGGHTTAAVARADGGVAKLPVTGPLLGALEDIELENLETHLEPDDCLFLYTDGLTEARRGGELYGEDRLFAALIDSEDRRPRKLMHRVVADMMAYSHGRLRDDLAILAVKRAPEGPARPHQSKLLL